MIEKAVDRARSNGAKLSVIHVDVDLKDLYTEMIDIDKIEGQVQSSALKRITEIVDKHPEEAASVIRGWLTQRA